MRVGFWQFSYFKNDHILSNCDDYSFKYEGIFFMEKK